MGNDCKSYKENENQYEINPPYYNKNKNIILIPNKPFQTIKTETNNQLQLNDKELSINEKIDDNKIKEYENPLNSSNYNTNITNSSKKKSETIIELFITNEKYNFTWKFHNKQHISEIVNRIKTETKIRN